MADEPRIGGDDLRARISVLEEAFKGYVAALEQRFEDRDKALQLNAAEIHRRLTELNHAHELARDTLATYTPRLAYDKSEAETREWRRKVDAQLVAMASKNATLYAVFAGAILLVGLIVAVANYLTKA